MKTILSEERFNIISAENKDFIIAFDNEISTLGYGFGGSIGIGACWGRYMIIYSKIGAKSKQVIARIYVKENCIILRLFLNNIDKHREYIENSQTFIKEVFTGEHGNCHHCHNEKDGKCKFRKAYTLESHYIQKCNGITFEFSDPNLEKLPDYMSLLKEFYPIKRINKVK